MILDHFWTGFVVLRILEGKSESLVDFDVKVRRWRVGASESLITYIKGEKVCFGLYLGLIGRALLFLEDEEGILVS